MAGVSARNRDKKSALELDMEITRAAEALGNFPLEESFVLINNRHTEISESSYDYQGL